MRDQHWQDLGVISQKRDYCISRCVYVWAPPMTPPTSGGDNLLALAGFGSGLSKEGLMYKQMCVYDSVVCATYRLAKFLVEIVEYVHCINTVHIIITYTHAHWCMFIYIIRSGQVILSYFKSRQSY